MKNPQIDLNRLMTAVSILLLSASLVLLHC
jgi:hypothetical protein